MPKGQPGTLTHGLSGYSSGRCKCDICREAMTTWRRARYGQRPREVVNAEREPAHGTQSRYTNRGCRCDLCREAASTARREHRHANPEATRAYDRAYKRRRRAKAA